MKTQTFTRKTLYDLVWSTTRVNISKQFTISNDGIVKLCKNFNIPFPKSGYWSKLKYNKPVKKEALPLNFKGEDKIELINKEEGVDYLYEETPISILTKEIENDKKAPLKVAKKLKSPDVLTRNTIEYFEYRKNGGGYYQFKKETLPIREEIKDRNRALLFMDSLVKLLRYRGYSFERVNYSVKIIIKGVKIEFNLREINKRVKGEGHWPSSTLIPTGKLALKVGRYSGEKEFADGKLQLEQQLGTICAFIELYAEREIEWEEEIRIYHLKREEEEKIKKVLKERKEKELANFKELISLSKRYKIVKNIRAYISAVEKNAKKNKALNEELKSWLKWASNKADWYDPMINANDELLNDAEKK